MMPSRLGTGQLRTVAKHAKLWRRFVVQSAVRETHYRLNFLTTIGIGFIQLGLALIPVLLLFEYTDDIRGWSRPEVLAVVGLYQLGSGLLMTAVAPTLRQMGHYIVRGELDGVLTRPVSSQFYMTFRWLNLAELGNVATGVVLLALGLARAVPTWPDPPGPVEILVALVVFGCGLVLVTCAWSAASYLVFWLHQVHPVMALFQSLVDTGRYPVAFFPIGVRAFLIFAVPVAFASTFPIEALRGSMPWWPLLVGPLLCVGAIALLRAFWRFGLRFYASASS